MSSTATAATADAKTTVGATMEAEGGGNRASSDRRRQRAGGSYIQMTSAEGRQAQGRAQLTLRALDLT